MADDKKIFPVVLIGLFVAALLIGVFLFSGVIGKNSAGSKGPVGTAVIWGTLPRALIGEPLEKYYTKQKYAARYEEKNPETYRETLLEAFSSGTGPDLFLVSNSDAISFESKATLFPIDSFPLREFRNTFVSEAELFVRPEGYVAMPLILDPIVLYWNRALFDNAGIPEVPTTWDEIIEITPRLTRKTDTGIISDSAIALGTWDNINHAKDILSLLIMQKNNPVSFRGEDGTIQPTFQVAPQGVINSAAEDAYLFLTSFSDPLSPSYTWNRALPLDRTRFAQSALAMYVGRASDLFTIQAENPNLNFDVTVVPQFGEPKVTYGELYGIAISKFSQKLDVDYAVLIDMASPDFQKELSASFSLPPVRRDLLSIRPSGDPYISTFFDSSLYARGWYDPNPQKTEDIFEATLDTIVSGTLAPFQAIAQASGDFSLLNVQY